MCVYSVEICVCTRACAYVFGSGGGEPNEKYGRLVKKITLWLIWTIDVWSSILHNGA